MIKSIIFYLKKYSFLLGIFLFVIILIRTDLGSVLVNIKNVKFSYLSLAALFSFPVLLIKGFCWNYIKKIQNIHYNLRDSFLMYGAGLYIGGITPGRVGEISRALYLKRDGHSFGKSMVSLVLDRLSDIIFLLILLLFGSLFVFDFSYQQILIFITIIFLLFFLFFIYLKLNITKNFLRKLFYFFIPIKYQKSWKINFRNFVSDIKIYKFRNYLIVFLLTVLSWFFCYIQIFITARSAGIVNVPFLYLSVVFAIISFINLIPVSILGIGTRETTLIFFLSPFLILKEQIIVFSSLILLIYLFTVLIGLICWLIKPISISDQ